MRTDIGTYPRLLQLLAKRTNFVCDLTYVSSTTQLNKIHKTKHKNHTHILKKFI